MNDRVAKSTAGSDRAGADLDDELERSGIVLERRSAPGRTGRASRILGHWGENHVKYTSAATFLGIIFTFWQLNLSVNQFEQQMQEQRKSTSSQLVSDFFRQVGDMTALASTQVSGLAADRKEIERFIVSRAQMLIDSEQTSAFRNEIVRFLGSNGYGPFFGAKPNAEEPGINLNSANLKDIRIYGADFSKASFYCVGFEHANIDKTKFIHSDINNSDFSGSMIGGVDFSSSNIRKVYFTNVTLIGQPTFRNASILHSDITGLTVVDSFVRAQAETNGDSSAEGMKKARYQYLARLLSESKSLFGTRMDTELITALVLFLGPERYQAMTKAPPGEQVAPIDARNTSHAINYRAGCTQAVAGEA